jgi:methionine aminotransferase
MSKLASDHNAINLSQGFPDFDVHPDLLALVDNYMRSGHNQYAPMQGVQALRDQIAEKVFLLGAWPEKQTRKNAIKDSLGGSYEKYQEVYSLIKTHIERVIPLLKTSGFFPAVF